MIRLFPRSLAHIAATIATAAWDRLWADSDRRICEWAEVTHAKLDEGEL